MTQNWPFKTADFGNTWLEHAAEVSAPEPVNWLPATPFGYGIVLLLIVLIARHCWRLWQHWQNNAYRRAGLRQLQQIRAAYAGGEHDAIRQLPELLRYSVMQVLSREDAVALQDKNWQRFLTETTPPGAEQNVSEEQLQLLLQLPYAPPQQNPLSEAQVRHCFEWSEHWLSRHQTEALYAAARRCRS